jgi:hypothetical protein
MDQFPKGSERLGSGLYGPWANPFRVIMLRPVSLGSSAGSGFPGDAEERTRRDGVALIVFRGGERQNGEWILSAAC